MKTLVLYYSYTGNTRALAERICRRLHCDSAELVPETPYTGSYDAVVEQGQREVDRGYCPKLRPLGVRLADYDCVILGTPTWWYTMAPAVHTALGEYDWSGKTVVPFQTHAGWPGHTLADLKQGLGGARSAGKRTSVSTPKARDVSRRPRRSWSSGSTR